MCFYIYLISKRLSLKEIKLSSAIYAFCWILKNDHSISLKKTINIKQINSNITEKIFTINGIDFDFGNLKNLISG
jgi:hypothetical protein